MCAWWRPARAARSYEDLKLKFDALVTQHQETNATLLQLTATTQQLAEALRALSAGGAPSTAAAAAAAAAGPGQRGVGGVGAGALAGVGFAGGLALGALALLLLRPTLSSSSGGRG